MVRLTQRIATTFAAAAYFVLLSAATVHPQRLAIITPENSPQSLRFANTLGDKLGVYSKLIDAAMAEAAYRSGVPENPFNQTRDEAKRIGATVGCDFFILLRTMALRRSSSTRPHYYEATAFVYLISSRTGRLVDWKLYRFEADSATAAQTELFASAGLLAAEIAAKASVAMKSEIDDPRPRDLEEMPVEGSPAAKNFRPPVPYLRIKPEYTDTAYLYDVAGTVEIEVDIDDHGRLTRTDVVRWAGFGLDESAVRTVHAMTWRPAERNGKALPMRVLLRYNFRKVEKTGSSQQ